MGASKKLATSNADKAAAAAARANTLAGIRAVGVSVGNIFSEVIPASEWEGCADELAALLTQIDATGGRDELREIVLGAMAAIGYDVKPA